MRIGASEIEYRALASARGWSVQFSWFISKF